MPCIQLTTIIRSGLNACFDLATSIDLHRLSTTQTKEQAIDGRTEGLIRLNEFVTWRATHFGIRQTLTTKITAYDRPFHFRDEQIKGIFKLLRHDHFFEQQGQCVVMKDVFVFESPFGMFGKVFNKLILTRYLTKFLMLRNEMIKEFAESGQWKELLRNNP